MKVTITRVGTTQKYADGWDKAFGAKKKVTKKKAATATTKKKTAKKKTAKKKAAKKR